MIVRYFNNTKPINIVLLTIILSILILLSYYFKNTLVFSLQNSLKLGVLLLSFFVFHIITKGKLLSSEKDFGILFYVIISGLFSFIFFNLNTIIANFLIFIAFEQLYCLNKKIVNVTKKVFNYGFFIGIASLFFQQSLFFLPLGFIAVILFNKISWRNFLIIFIGFFFVYFFTFIISDLFKLELLNIFNLSIYFSTPFFFKNTYYSITIIILGLIVLWSLFNNFNHIELTAYKFFFIIVVFQLLISIFILFSSPLKDGSEIIFLVFPISVLLANAIPQIRKKSIGNLIIIILISFIFMNYNF